MYCEPIKMKHRFSVPYYLIILTIFVLCMIISRFFCQLTLIEGRSMEPSYHSGQFVLVNRTKQEYHTGDIILFRCKSLNATLVKRIAAGPGDTVLITQGQLFVNGTPAPGYTEIDYPGIAAEELTLDSESFFVLGDNITESKDSRYEEIGIVNIMEIIGKVF